MGTRSFFRWLPTAIILWTLGVLCAACAVICLVDARRAAHGSIQVAMIGDSQRTEHWFLEGAIADACAAMFCIVGWFLMWLRLPATLALGGVAVTFATGILTHRSMIYLIRGDVFASWSDLLLDVPVLLYAIIYAWQECRKTAVKPRPEAGGGSAAG